MTPEEKKAAMDQRNLDICACYVNGASLAETCSKFKLGRQRVRMILEAAGVWRPYRKSERIVHLGVTVSQETKDKLNAAAEAAGESASKFTSDLLEEKLA